MPSAHLNQSYYLANVEKYISLGTKPDLAEHAWSEHPNIDWIQDRKEGYWYESKFQEAVHIMTSNNAN